MSGTTTKLALPYPQGTDGPDGADVPYWINLLAVALDTKVASYDFGSTLPAAGKAGRFFRLTSTSPNEVYLDTGSVMLDVSGFTQAIADTLYAAIDDPALTDQRVPTDGSVTAAKIANALKPSAGAGGGTETLRALGTTAATAAAGNDSRLHSLGDLDARYAALRGIWVPAAVTVGGGSYVANTLTDLIRQTIPGGTLGTNRKLCVELEGDYIQHSGADGKTLRLLIGYGATTIVDINGFGAFANNGSRKTWSLKFNLSAKGSVSVQNLNGSGRFVKTTTTANGATNGTGGEVATSSPLEFAGAAAEASGSDKALFVQAAWNIGDVNVDIRMNWAMITAVG